MSVCERGWLVVMIGVLIVSVVIMSVVIPGGVWCG